MNHASRPSYYNNANTANCYYQNSQPPRTNIYGQPYQPSYQPVPTTGNEHQWLDVPLQPLNAAPPASGGQPSAQSSAANLTKGGFRLIAILPPDDATPLNFRPICLKAPTLWTNAIICLILAGCIFAVLYGVGSDRQALLTGENAHYLSTYGPALIATINLMCFRVTFFEAFRMLPYFRMADQKGQVTKGANAAKSIGGSYFPWLASSFDDNPALKLPSLLVLYSVSFLTTFKSVFLGSQQTEGGWILTVHAKPSYYLVGAYSTMAIFYLTLWIVTRTRSTGLKWDPAAPCDHLALVWRTDAMSQISELPVSYKKAYDVLRKDVNWRIGYWRRYDKQADGSEIESVVHGIGMLEGVRREVCHEEGTCICQHSGKCTFSRFLHPPTSSWYFLSALIVSLLVFVAVCVFVIIKGIFMNGQDLSGPWLKLNATYASNDTAVNATATDITHGYIIVAGQVITAGDSTTANIIFRAIPTWIAGFYAPYFEGMEIRLRDVTWISALAAGPQPSSKSIALDYATQFSFVIPATASERGHFRLALIAFVNTFAPLCPVFVAGMVIFERRSAEQLHLIISKTSFIVVCVYIVAFLAATIAAWPRKTELLLRPFFSIADFVKPFADSWMLEEDTALDSAMSERTRERFRAKILLADYHYQLGITKGTCGKSHRGIDIVEDASGAKARNIIPAADLIREMKTHKKGQSDGYSRIEAGLGEVHHLIGAGVGARSGN